MRITLRLTLLCLIAALAVLGQAAADDRCVDLESDGWRLNGCIEDGDTASWNAPHPFYDRRDWESFPLDRYREAAYEWAFYAPTPESLYDGSRQRDHLVALAEAHQSGGAYWPDAIKAAFALGAQNIYWLPAAVNNEKWSHDPAGWRPARPAVHQPYAVHWIQIKRKWYLSFDAPEIAALRQLLHTPP